MWVFLLILASTRTFQFLRLSSVQFSPVEGIDGWTEIIVVIYLDTRKNNNGNALDDKHSRNCFESRQVGAVVVVS